MKNGTHVYPILRTVQLLMGGTMDEKQFLAVYIHEAALLQLQNLATSMRENYVMLKEALCEKFIPKERVKLHKAEFCARHCKQDEKLPDLASSLRRLVSQASPEAVPDLHDNLAKGQFIDALEDREIWTKLRVWSKNV